MYNSFSHPRRTRVGAFVALPASNRKTKHIIMDEVEGMTDVALFALRNIMEENNNTIFFLLCNDIRRLSSPIRSRCIEFEFLPLERKILREMTFEFCQDLDLRLTDEVG